MDGKGRGRTQSRSSEPVIISVIVDAKGRSNVAISVSWDRRSEVGGDRVAVVVRFMVDGSATAR